MAKTAITATAEGFDDSIEVWHSSGERSIDISQRESGALSGTVCLTRDEVDDLIVVLQYALSLMEDTDEVS